MEREYSHQAALTGMYINLEARTIEFEDRYGTVGRLVLGEEVVLYEGAPLVFPTPDCAAPDAPPTPAAEADPERPPDYLGCLDEPPPQH